MTTLTILFNTCRAEDPRKLAIKEWLADLAIEHSWSCAMSSNPDHTWRQEISFAEMRDALLFKLTWGGR